MSDAATQAAAHKAAGNAALKEDRLDDAIAEYTKAIELDGTNHVFYSNRSATYLRKGDKQAALDDAIQCIKVKPDWAKGYNRKGAAQHALGDYKGALETYEAGLKVDPSNAGIQAAMEDVKRVMAKPAAPAASAQGPFGDQMMARLVMNPKFREYMKDPQYMSMLKMLQANPNNLSMLQNDKRIMETIAFLFGMELPAGGAGGGAGAAPAPAPAPAAAAKEPEAPAKNETAEEKAQRETREAADKIKAEGNALYKKKDFDGALAKYEEALKADPTHVVIMLNKAAVYAEQRNYDACFAECDAAVARARELHADYEIMAKAFARKGNVLYKMKKYDEAIEQYENSLLEKHNDKVYAMVKKSKKLRKKAAEEAYWDKDKAAEAKARGNAAFKEGKWKQAMEEYSEAIKRDPTNAVYYMNRATARSKVMDFQGALEDVDTSIAKDPKYVKAYWRKGLIQQGMKEYHKAMDSFKAGLAIDPDSKECKQGLQQVVARVNAGMSGEVDKERAAHAMADPEIQAILQDPVLQQTLRDMQTSPAAAAKAMQDPGTAAKIQKLVAAGVLQMR